MSMAVPQQLLEQLLALDESVRLELAHALLASVEADDQGMSDADRQTLCAATDRSLEQAAAGAGSLSSKRSLSFVQEEPVPARRADADPR